MNGESNNPGGMRPEIGQSFITLPITFNYSGGRQDSNKNKHLWAAILSLIGTISGIVIMFSDRGTRIGNIIFGLVVIFLIFLIVRYPLLGEGRIRKELESVQENDYKRPYSDIWGIYSIDDEYPYYCRFANGKSGVFIRLNKDVILGKYSEAEYQHYEAISDAYNLAGSGRVTMAHVDYMDNVGTDERLEESFIELGNVENPDLKELLTSIFSYQQEQMMKRVTTFDTYVFTWSGSDINAWNTIQRILACFMEANYRSYHVLNSNDLRDFVEVLYNLEDFSVIEAESTAFNNSSRIKEKISKGIVPIEFIDAYGNSTKLNLTQEEQKEESERKKAEEEAKKQEIKRRRKNKRNKDKNDEVVDIFDDDEDNK